MHMLVVGNPFEGFRFVGPFDSLDDAQEFGEAVFPMMDWWFCELENPASVALTGPLP